MHNDGAGRLALGFGYDLTSRTASTITSDLNTINTLILNGAETLNYNNIQITRTDAFKLFYHILPSYINAVSNHISLNFDNDNKKNTKEYLGLLSLAYNNSILLGDNLNAALKENNRAEAWYEVRYKSNLEQISNPALAPGIAKRRYFESEMLGLYNDENNVSEEEARSTFEMFYKHENTIRIYDNRFLHMVAEANTTYDPFTVQTRQESFKEGKEKLVSLYAPWIESEENFDEIIEDLRVIVDVPENYIKRNSAGVVTERRDQNNISYYIDPENNKELETRDLIFGESGNDTIDAGALNDVVFGDKDNDTIGNDSIQGGSGDDTIFCGAGSDTISGGSDNDLIIDVDGLNLYYFYLGDYKDDLLPYMDLELEEYKNSSGNNLNGNEGNDKIVQKGNLNTLSGGQGSDLIVLHGDNNIVLGGSDNDTIIAHAGNNNTLDGDIGADSILGGTGNDIIIGGEGRDVLKGGDGDDTYKLSIGDTEAYLNDYLLGGEAIVDSDGWGEIIYDDNKITGGTIKRLSHKKNDSRKMYDYVASDGNTYKWHGIDGQSLEITTKNKDKIWIPKFNNGDLDINLNIEKVYFEDIGDAGVKAIQDKQKVSKFKSPTYGSTLYGDIGSDTISGGSGSDTITIDSGVGPDPTVPSTPDPTNREINTDQINNNIKDQWEPAKTTVSPLVIDLNGDGINTLGFTAGVYFDLDANGFAESCGWIDTNDGFLALDRNENGKIDDGRELFGDQTLLQNNSLAHGGFEALADLDSNQDGVINEADDEFENLKVWQDSNVNGLSSEDELHSLSEFGIMIHFKYG